MNRAKIDLRSDTMTTPSAGMREAMAAAEVGDDVWGEDPTVKRLEETVAGLLDKPAGLFVPSGTMANQVALLVHTRPGDDVIAAAGSHCVAYEGGAAAAFAGVQIRELGQDGLLEPSDLQVADRPANDHFAPIRLTWLENSHNRSGGRVYPLATLQAIAEEARRLGLRVHIDGARLFNAAIATDCEPRQIAQHAHSASICLSKGLGAPIGSVLVGDRAFISQARRQRKRMGGGMRQSGIVAAAGLYALDRHLEKLPEDHQKAALLGQGIDELSNASAIQTPQTNIVIFDVREGLDAKAINAQCAAAGVLLSQLGPRRLRAVTHRDVSLQDCERAVAVLQQHIG